MDEQKLALKGLTADEIAAYLAEMGEPRYRAKQICEWVFKRNVTDFAAMTNLPQTLRAKLAATAEIDNLKILRKQVSAIDGTTKYLFALADGEQIESVLMLHRQKKSGYRFTACISTQVGCAMGCTFCATGISGLRRNLTAAEIVNQVLTIQADRSGIAIDNVVFMGMGEPLHNYDAVLKAIRILNAPTGLGIGARHITVSTCGLVPAIRRFATEGLQVVLAISLHAPNDALRNQIVPINRKYPLQTLIDACREYTKLTGRRITFEYTLIAGLNDQPQHARELVQLLRGLLCNVNLIPVNPVQLSYARPSTQQVKLFKEILTDGGITAVVREEKGTDIDAACGQLRGRSEDNGG